MKYLNQFDMIKPYELAKRPRELGLPIGYANNILKEL